MDGVREVIFKIQANIRISIPLVNNRFEIHLTEDRPFA
jgi:hypothetical protein